MCGEAATKRTMELRSGSEPAIRTTQPCSNPSSRLVLGNITPVVQKNAAPAFRARCLIRMDC